MVESARKPSTYVDLLALPEETRAEVLGGEIVVSPARLPRHSTVQRTLSRFLGGPFDDDHGREGPGGWWIFVEVDVQLSPHDVVRPDMTGWRRERLPRPGAARPIEVAPDWICEVLSPATAARDRVAKRGLYGRAGVPWYWLIDPQARVLEALRREGDAWLEVGTYDDTATARIPPFDAIELEVGRLFLPREADDLAEE